MCVCDSFDKNLIRARFQIYDEKIYKCERILFVKRPLFIARSQFYRRIGFIVVTFSGKHIYLKGKDTGPERQNKNHNTNCVTAEVDGLCALKVYSEMS